MATISKFENICIIEPCYETEQGIHITQLNINLLITYILVARVSVICFCSAPGACCTKFFYGTIQIINLVEMLLFHNFLAVFIWFDTDITTVGDS